MGKCSECGYARRVDVGYYCVYHCTLHRDKIVEIADTLFNETEYLDKPCKEESYVKKGSE